MRNKVRTIARAHYLNLNLQQCSLKLFRIRSLAAVVSEQLQNTLHLLVQISELFEGRRKNTKSTKGFIMFQLCFIVLIMLIMRMSHF